MISVAAPFPSHPHSPLFLPLSTPPPRPSPVPMTALGSVAQSAMFSQGSGHAFDRSSFANVGGHYFAVNVAVDTNSRHDNTRPPVSGYHDPHANTTLSTGLVDPAPRRPATRPKGGPLARILKKLRRTSRSQAQGPANKPIMPSDLVEVNHRFAEVGLQEDSSPGHSPRIEASTVDVLNKTDSLSSCRSSDGMVSVTSLERLDIYSQSSRSSSLSFKTHSEVYEQHMYSTGHGYPCSTPQPLGAPPTIGDIGTRGIDGFQALFNLYNLPPSFTSKYPVPEADYMLQRRKFSEGETLAAGISGAEVVYEADKRTIDYFHFKCLADQGAALAMPTGADLESLNDPFALHQFICDHASQIFITARSIRSLPPHESLYVVTGCIKTDVWATVAHRDPMREPDNQIVLTNRGIVNPSDTTPTYSWTKKGNAETRSGRSVTLTQDAETEKDQCLFLRGFLLTPSRSSSRRPENPASGNDGRDSQNSGSDGDRPDGGEKRQGPHSSNNRNGTGSSGLGCSYPTNGGSWSCSSADSFESLPEAFIECDSFPKLLCPSQRVNDMLLEETHADFAITHDDDWRDILKGRYWDEDGVPYLLESIRENRSPSIYDGVARLVSENQTNMPTEQYLNAEAQAEALVRLSNMESPRVRPASDSTRVEMGPKPRNNSLAYVVSNLKLHIAPFSCWGPDTQTSYKRKWKFSTPVLSIVVKKIPAHSLEDAAITVGDILTALGDNKILQFYDNLLRPDPHLRQTLSPWNEHGDVVYIGTNPGVDHGTIITEMARGIEYLHSKTNTHGDLRAANVLVSHTGKVLITDFGVAAHISADEPHPSFSASSGGTTRWQAPELINGTCALWPQTDVWSSGLETLGVLTGKHPYAFGKSRGKLQTALQKRMHSQICLCSPSLVVFTGGLDSGPPMAQVRSNPEESRLREPRRIIHRTLTQGVGPTMPSGNVTPPREVLKKPCQ